MENSIFVNVIIVTMNRCSLLKKCIESVKKQTYSFYDITVIDNHSNDDTVQMLENEYPEVWKIKLDRNLGCPGARNLGILNTHGDVLFFVDDDGLLEPDVLEVIVKEFSSELELGVVVTAIKENNKWLIRPKESEEKKRVYLPGFQGQGAIRRSVFEKLGLYPTQFIYGAEELDLSFRILDNGYRIIFQPKALTYHFRTNQARDSKQDIEKARNHFLVILKYIPFPLVIPWGLKRLFVLLLTGVKEMRLIALINCLIHLPRTVFLIMSNRKFTSIANRTVFLQDYLLSNSITDYDSISINSDSYHSIWGFQIKKILKSINNFLISKESIF